MVLEHKKNEKNGEMNCSYPDGGEFTERAPSNFQIGIGNGLNTTDHRNETQNGGEMKGFRNGGKINGFKNPGFEQDSDISPADVKVNLDDESSEDKDSTGSSTESTRKSTSKIGLFKILTSFADRTSYMLMVIGMLSAVLSGATFPVNLYIYGKVTTLFIEHTIRRKNQTSFIDGSLFAATNITTVSGELTTMSPELTESLTDQVFIYIIYFIVLGVTFLITFATCSYCWDINAERREATIRKLFFKSILHQDISWFDSHKIGELTAIYSENITKLRNVYGVKLAYVVRWQSTGIMCYVFAIYANWKLALVVLTICPVLIITLGLSLRLAKRYVSAEAETYLSAGSVAEQAISGIRTVAAFGGQEKECERYCSCLDRVKSISLKKSLAVNLGNSTIWSIIFIVFGFFNWYALSLYRDSQKDPGAVITVLFSVLVGSVNIANSLPNVEDVMVGCGSASLVYDVINSEPIITKSYNSGEQLENIDGEIQFHDVVFQYPSRPDVTVLDELNIEIKSGETVALVGSSGCGKSTTAQLIQRFYDPTEGKITVDGVDIRKFDLKWLREQIGVVSQEPILFGTTIAENIKFGRISVTQKEIVEAAKKSNAHGFISRLPKKYETLVGERGSQLSAGQKQRVAIARALVRNPKILILDEATSALDNENEAIVQQALDDSLEGRTTLIIAHRLSTVRNADKIVVLRGGRVVEQGKHDDLLEQKGPYYELVMQQLQGDDSDEEITEDDDQTDEIGNGHASRHIPLLRALSYLSTTSEHPDDFAEEEAEKDKLVPLRRLMALNSPELRYIVMAAIFAVFCGLIHPMLSVVTSEFLDMYTLPYHEAEVKAKNIVGFMVGFGLFVGIVRMGLVMCVAISGTRLTLRLRIMVFKAVLGQDVEFFDDPQNSVGSITARLAHDAALVQGATGTKVGTALEHFSTLLICMIVAFVFGWKLALVILAFMPVALMSGAATNKMALGAAIGNKKIIAEAGSILSECVDNIRTVSALTIEKSMQEKYDQLVDQKYNKEKLRALVQGIFLGVTQSMLYFAFAGAFAYGAYLVQEDEMEFYNVFRVFSVIIFGAQSVGRRSADSPDYIKGRLAAARLLALVDRKPKIDIYSKSGDEIEDYDGSIDLQKVEFRYPSRRDIRVLKGLSLKVDSGLTVALVGHSGCGKSTVIQLLERFYNPTSGTVKFESRDSHELNTSWIRSQIGLVSQEPILFDCSIAENIAYGDNTQEVTTAEIIEASRKANIHSFIQSLPQGYETNVGSKGTQLSGGQKQRVAIARALIRNPKILLLDEATSALDVESERVVQDALDQAAKGRTSIIIAHRLSTIENADVIAVFANGQICETGSHAELMEYRGLYYDLQSTANKKSR